MPRLSRDHCEFLRTATGESPSTQVCISIFVSCPPWLPSTPQTAQHRILGSVQRREVWFVKAALVEESAELGILPLHRVEKYVEKRVEKRAEKCAEKCAEKRAEHRVEKRVEKRAGDVLVCIVETPIQAVDEDAEGFRRPRERPRERPQFRIENSCESISRRRMG